MARAHFAENLKEELTCPVCMDYFRHPVTLGCGHSFCHSCLLSSSGEVYRPWPCPLCKRAFHLRDLESNHRLGKLASIGKKLEPYLPQLEEEKITCKRHQEEKKLFCEKDQSFLCVDCFQPQEHIRCTVHTVKKAAEDSRDKLQKILDLLWKEVERVQNMLTEEREKKKTWKENVHTWRQSMTAEYTRFHELLKKEKKLHFHVMAQQESCNLKSIRESETRLSQHLHSLRDMIMDMEQHNWKTNSQLLQVRITIGSSSRNCHHFRDHISKYYDVGNAEILQSGDLMLSLFVCSGPEKLNHSPICSFFSVDVTLDPKNPAPHLILSDDLRTVVHRGSQQNIHFSINQYEYNFILGAQLFTSGIHYWEVEVGDGRQWAVGVCKKSLRSYEDDFLPFEEIFLLSCVRKGDKYTITTTPPYFEHQVHFPIRRVGILLDCDEGTISFYDASERCFIYHFPHFPFSGPLQPLFSPSPPMGKENGIPMTIRT
ncbi:probable E3 ubiquitin-protein ligase TRIML1 [Trichosurus vulpecula]|uniref:probable E3 ubiquitin-protein ligase TRIML1 n=1 Tax=Trichosurus vulpecula TaxID=9337 RepID=UPI00186B502C|nr:probable E3 ubiquitin-protein ligase TRIML1 [Trichosurus vulpecula]